MNEKENKSLRDKLNAFQVWMSGQVDLGLMSLERTPECFDRTRYKVEKEAKDTHTIGSHCYVCSKPFAPGEEKETDNHIQFRHKKPCSLEGQGEQNL